MSIEGMAVFASGRNLTTLIKRMESCLYGCFQILDLSRHQYRSLLPCHQRLQVRHHTRFDTTDARIIPELCYIGVLPAQVISEALKGKILSEFVSVTKHVTDCLFLIVHLHRCM